MNIELTELKEYLRDNNMEDWLQPLVELEIRNRTHRHDVENLEQKNEKLNLLIDSIYNIDTKYIDNNQVTYRDYYNDSIDLIEQHKKQSKQ